MEKNLKSEIFDFSSFQKEQSNFDLKVNINKKREHSVNQLLSLIPGNEFLNKKRKKNKNKSNFQSTEKPSEKEEKNQFKKLYDKRKYLLTKSFTFKESTSISKKNNANSNININNKDLLTPNILEDKTNSEIHYAFINTNNNKFVPDYEPWDKELLEVILNNDTNLINNYCTLSVEELNNIIVDKLENMDDNEKKNNKLLELISYTQHPIPLSNEAKDKEDQTNLQFMLTKKEKKSLKKIYQEQKRKDIQEKIKLGLLKPKENKLKYSNMIQLFKNDSIINPSQVYQKVQNSYKEREQKMLEENAKNALTKEQKKLKFRSKIEKDQENGMYGYFFRVNKIYDIGNYNRFNSWIKIFCKKYRLSGFMIHFFKSKENFVYLEGGQKALNKIHNRIKNKLKIEENNLRKRNEKKEIKENIDNKKIKDEKKKNIVKNIKNEKEEENNDKKDFCCVLKWKGMVKKKNFWNFQIIIKQNLQEFMQYLIDTDLIYLYNNIN